MWIQFPITLMVLIVTGISLLMKKNTVWLVPSLVANSLIGVVYVINENNSLQNVGTGIFGHKFKTNTVTNIILNALWHGMTPIILLSFIDWKAPIAPIYTLLFEIVGLLTIDINNTYPSAKGMRVYIWWHIALVLITTAIIMFIQRS